MPNRLAARDLALPAPARGEPRRLVPVGRGGAAAARAREDKPILVSIGYAACHWCHVMERESFEDPEVAALMNERFVCVKVDREERPDVDAIYMEAVQAMTGRGGWPLNAFLTPEGVPFYAGTYFPPEPRHGMPSWPQVLVGVAEAWRDQRDEIEEHGRADPAAARGRGARSSRPRASSTRPSSTRPSPRCGAATTPRTAASRRARRSSPPPRRSSSCCAAASARWRCTRCARWPRAACTTRSAAASRATRSTRAGSIPHFEKMLYDNALLARAYLHGLQVSGEPFFARVCTETLDWALRDLRQEEGGFASALDADSEGEEGKLLRLDARRGARGARRRRARRGGAGVLRHRPARRNFEGAERPVRATSDPRAAAPRSRRACASARERRVWPALDDKRLTAWNALMISALADAGAALERADYRDAAVACAEFVWRDMRDADGRLLRTYNRGQARLGAYLEDHAFLLEALLTLYEATFDPRWFAAARELAETILARFADAERGGFFATADDHEALVARRKELEDTPIPSGASAAAFGLLRLARADRRAPLRGGGARRAAAAARASRRSTRRRSATCCRRSTSTSRRSREVAIVGAGRRAARARRARRVPPARRRRRRAGRRRAAARGPRAGRRPRRRLRVRALRLPAAGHRAGRARGAALTKR